MTPEERIEQHGTFRLSTIDVFYGEGFLATVTSAGRFTQAFGCDRDAALNSLLECLEDRQ